MVRFLISTPETMRNELKEIAKEHGQTLNGLIRQILWEWVENQGKQDKETKYAGN